MAPRRPRDIGTAAESATVRYLQTAGFPQAERRALRGAADAGDITGTPGLAWSVKGGDAAKTASDQTIADWLAELQQQTVHARADLGVLVTQRPRVGPGNAGRWWAWIAYADLVGFGAAADPPGVRPVRLLLADMTTILRCKGYGEGIDG